MRFASVYRSFSSLADFEAEIADLRAAHGTAYAHDGEVSHVDRFAGAHDPAPPPVKVPAAAAPCWKRAAASRTITANAAARRVIA